MNSNDKLGDMEENIKSDRAKIMEDFEAQLDRIILQNKENMGSHIEEKMKNFKARLEGILLEKKDNMRSHIEETMETAMAELQRFSLEGKENNRSHIDKWAENLMAKLERSSSKDKAPADRVSESCGKQSYNLKTYSAKNVESANFEDLKCRPTQQACKGKKNFKEMTKKDEGQPDGSDKFSDPIDAKKRQVEKDLNQGKREKMIPRMKDTSLTVTMNHKYGTQRGGNARLADLPEGEKQQEEKVTHKDGRQPHGYNGLSEMTKGKKQQHAQKAEEMSKKDRGQPDGKDEFSDLIDAEKRQKEKDVNQGKREKVIYSMQDTSSSLKGSIKMEEPLEEIVRSTPDGFSDFSEAEKREVKELNETRKEAIGKVDKSAKVLRKAADKIDKVWRECKIAHASGTSAAILGGFLTIVGGIATIMTAGAATPLMLAGIGFGAAGAATKVGTSIVEACINSIEIKEADECLKMTLACMRKLRQKALVILGQKYMGRSVKIFGLALHTQKLSESIIKIFQDLALHVLNIPSGFVKVASESAKRLGKDSADDAAEAVAKAAAKRAGGVIIGISVFFLALDLIDLGFTIRDLVKNEGLEATKTLRHIADQLEKEACRLKC